MLEVVVIVVVLALLVLAVLQLRQRRRHAVVGRERRKARILRERAQEHADRASDAEARADELEHGRRR